MQHLRGRHDVHVLAQRGVHDPEPQPPDGVALETVVVNRGSTTTRLALGVARALMGGPRPLQNGFYDHESLRAGLRRQLVEFRPDVVVLVLGRLGHLLTDLEQIAPDVPVVIDLIDALSLNFAQRARRERLLSWLWSWESRRLARWDASLAVRASAVTVVAERDRRALWEGASRARRSAMETSTHVVPLGLVLDEATEPNLDAVSPDGAPVVALTGNLGYFPTVDGALHFARHVWPAVCRQVPGARWLLAGARPAKALRELARLPGVEIVADPPDLQAIAGRAQVAVAPMRSGSGTPIKVLEAMSWGIPVVATPEAAAGLDGLPADALVIAETDEEFATRVSEFLTDRERARTTVRVARSWLHDRHGLASSASRFEAILRSVMR
ncbi:MAG: glycosyltransferase family 4 protein [Thermoanaerobaculia bacterium]|nr:glycosyltransferase family 4 protein [Thermoanaerobaculia bacterium]